MRKITYIILSLCLCTAGLGTAAHFSPSQPSLATVNDTVDVEDEFDDDDDSVEFLDDDEDEDEEDDDSGFFTEEEEEEFGQMHDESDDEATDEKKSSTTIIEDEEDEEIQLTEGMLINAEEQLSSYSAQNYLSEDSTKQATEFKDADADEYIRRLRRMPVIMEMPYNDIVRKYIDQYTTRMRRSVSVMLGAQNFYNPIFEEALEAEGCPLELKYLPVIESAYNPSATSRVGAAGLWQFMPSTGQTYGLEVNSLVDERRDPIKSSQAAAKYFKSLYSRYGDWNLVIAAYNCGPGNVDKAIQRAGEVKDYWKIYPYLPNETRGYVPAFIAANYVMQYYCEHGIVPMEAQLPAETDTLMISRDLHLQQVADLCNVSLDQLKELNPQYRQQIVPGLWKPCALRLPVDAVSKFIAFGDSIYAYNASELLPRRSTVSVSYASNNTTASRSNASASRSNSSSASRSSKSSSTSRNSKNSKSKNSKGKNSKGKNSKGKGKKGGPREITIRQGDNLTTIAKRHGTTVDKLQKLNGMKGGDTRIRAGKTLKVK